MGCFRCRSQCQRSLAKTFGSFSDDKLFQPDWRPSNLKTEPKLPCPAETRLSNPFGSSANLKFSIVAHPFSFPRTGYSLQDAWYVSCFGLSTKQKKERVKGGRLSSNQ
ncbi:hypothetical protein OUZ56_020974 [Daphnia magna]|uniref:Uncharacterized protein n=1 Tax=Daphnia magna TaxID=35525 RepID=A0ABQ9ZG07_9CRUS|nr:hypothetical protein OUZ56_020974 [Daphnia magna]